MKNSDFSEILAEFIGDQLKKYDLGIVTAELQNLAGDLLAECDDTEFKAGAVESFENRVFNK